jgi:cytochrome c
MFRLRELVLLVGVVVVAGGAALAGSPKPRYGYGRAPTADEIKTWDIDVRGGDGAGLPPGTGSVAEGEKIYGEQCASCHGDFGEGNGRFPELAGGQGTLKDPDPKKTVGSYWPYAPTVFDYVKRAMPFPAPQSLSDDEVYAVVAYILNMNDIIPADATLDAKSLAAVKMPNRDGFLTEDPRPDVHDQPCMTNCRKGPLKITSDLAKNLGVTPDRQSRN